MKRITTSLFYILLIFCCPIFGKAQANSTDSLALVELYNTTGGINWTNTWNLNQPVNSWQGVVLNGDGRVRGLNLSSNGLSGHISPAIGDLVDLTTLNLSSNQLSGNIPTTIGNLTNLTSLNLSTNQLSGSIPSQIGNLFNLTILSLRNNQLSGNIPGQIGNLVNLISLNLSTNQLSGSITVEIFDLVNLITLTLSNNQLSGNIPTQISGLVNLTSLNLSNNLLSGSITIEVGDLINLTNLNLSSNLLSGSIPAAIGDLVNLTILSLKNNQLSGNIPAAIGNLVNLTSLNLSNNLLSGSITVEIGDLVNLTTLTLSDNLLSGNIPVAIGDLINLKNLNLSNNLLSGSITEEIGDLANLESLNLSTNQLSGSTPEAILNLTNLTILSLSNNLLSGNIPTTIDNLTNLTTLNLSSNELSGSIPIGIGNLANLTTLNLSNNQLSGNIPSEIGNHASFIYLTNNLFSGTLPDFSNTPNLSFLSVASNQFSHEEIATNYTANNTLNSFHYSPQYYGIEQFITNDTLAEVVLSPNPPIPSENPTVLWRKGEIDLTQNYTLNDTTYVIDSLRIEDVGVYTYWFVDSALTPIIDFESRPINNYIEGLDLDGQPIIKGELIIEYGQDRTWTYIDSVRTEFMSSKYNGTIIDSCGCTVRIDLWKFGIDTIDIVHEIIGTDGKDRRTFSDSGIDGGQNRGNIFAPDYATGEQILVSSHTTAPNDTASVIIGVIDTGINTNHMAIQPNLWTNLLEYGGESGIDDDGNGCIDDIHGFDFIHGNEMSDGHGHGTKIGGMITANIPTDMNIRVLPVKTFNEEGQGTLFNLICGIYYAVENQSDIINISAGYKGQQSNILRRALQYGRDKNISFVVAAGNDTLDLDTENYWPATFTRDSTLLNTVFTVTAVDTNRTKLDYASYGDTTVTIAAPGQGIYVPSNIGNENYEYISGTSVSTSIVSLALALEKSQNPDRSYSTLRADFLSNVSTSPDLINHVKGGYVLDVNIQKLSKLKVFIAGAMSTNSDSMRTDLNERGLLPGQTPLSLLVEPTPEGQPYNLSPWNYAGTEWENTRDYLRNRVDWVLVSMRTEVIPDTEIYRAAAQLGNDGTVIFYQPVLDLNPVPDSVYIVVEHRNHMAVMSPYKIPIVDDRIIYDFTKQDSYKDMTSFGQIEIREGVWAMYGGDGAQENDLPFYDINADDKSIWETNNGNFDEYTPADYNLDGDINGEDKSIWGQNNGISNRVPK